MARLKRYQVHVSELSKDVLHERKFKKRNPGGIPGKPCVSMTGMTDVRDAVLLAKVRGSDVHFRG